jgi:hypothetical protein
VAEGYDRFDAGDLKLFSSVTSDIFTASRFSTSHVRRSDLMFRNSTTWWKGFCWTLAIFFCWISVFHVNGVRLCLWTAVTNGPIVHPPDDISMGEPRWNDTDGIKPKNSEGNPVPVTLYPLKSHMDWPRREFGSPQWEASYIRLSHGHVLDFVVIFMADWLDLSSLK